MQGLHRHHAGKLAVASATDAALPAGSNLLLKLEIGFDIVEVVQRCIRVNLVIGDSGAVVRRRKLGHGRFVAQIALRQAGARAGKWAQRHQAQDSLLDALHTCQW